MHFRTFYQLWIVPLPLKCYDVSIQKLVKTTGIEIDKVRKGFSLNSDKGLENSKEWREI